jgi:hypothetical protein
MTRPQTNEAVYYFEWDGEKHVQHDATARVIFNTPNPGKPKCHLTVLRPDESSENVNNVDSIELQNDMTGISYYVRRHAVWPVT